MIPKATLMNKIAVIARRFFTRPEYVFVAPALFFGILSATLTPQLIANDENMHFIRSYQLSDFGKGHICTIPEDIKDRGFNEIYSDEPNFSFETGSVDMDRKIETDCGTATTYNPLLHLPQTIGVTFAKIAWPTTGGMILFGRILNLLVYCAAVFFIIRKAKIGKWVLVIIGLLPMMIHMAGTLSGDVVNNVIILAFVTYVFNLFVQRAVMTRRQLVILVVLSGLLAVTKMTNIVLLLPVLFLPGAILPKAYLRKQAVSKYIVRLGIAALCGAAAIGVLLGWSFLYGDSVATGVSAANPVSDNPLLFFTIMFNTYINPGIMFEGTSFADWLLRGMVGSFASFEYYLPFGIVILVSCLFVLIGLKSDKKEEKMVDRYIGKLSLSVVISFVLAMTAMTYGLYVAWAINTEKGLNEQFALGLQGRYFIPLLALMIPIFIYLRKLMSVHIKEGAVTGMLIFAVMVFSLTFYIMQTLEYIAVL